MYEFAVRHGNWPVTVRGGYTYAGSGILVVGELAVEAVKIVA